MDFLTPGRKSRLKLCRPIVDLFFTKLRITSCDGDQAQLYIYFFVVYHFYLICTVLADARVHAWCWDWWGEALTKKAGDKRSVFAP